MIYGCVALWLSLSACKKENNGDEVREDTIEIEGVHYTIDELKAILSRKVTAPMDRLVFDSTDTSFHWDRYDEVRYRVVEFLKWEYIR